VNDDMPVDEGAAEAAAAEFLARWDRALNVWLSFLFCPKCELNATFTLIWQSGRGQILQCQLCGHLFALSIHNTKYGAKK
jgi:hypothetical protein